MSDQTPTITYADWETIRRTEDAADAVESLRSCLLEMGPRWHQAYVMAADLRRDLATYLDEIAPRSPYSNYVAIESVAEES